MATPKKKATRASASSERAKAPATKRAKPASKEAPTKSSKPAAKRAKAPARKERAPSAAAKGASASAKRAKAPARSDGAASVTPASVEPPEVTAAQARLRAYALSLPEAYEDFPWGESVAKVKKKVFVFMGKADGDPRIGFSVKLPHSGADALELPFTEPTGYGLGKAGWVTVRFPSDEDPPLEEFERWILESYRAVAPATLVKKLDAR